MTDERKDQKKDVDFGAWIEETFGFAPFVNPMIEDTYMALLTVNGRMMMGGIDDLPDPDAGFLVLYGPLLYAEVPMQQSEDGRSVGIAPAFQKPSLILQTLPYQLVHPESIYIFSKDRRSDKMLTQQYEGALKSHQGQDSGIEVISAMPPNIGRAH